MEHAGAVRARREVERIRNTNEGDAAAEHVGAVRALREVERIRNANEGGAGLEHAGAVRKSNTPKIRFVQLSKVSTTCKRAKS